MRHSGVVWTRFVIELLKEAQKAVATRICISRLSCLLDSCHHIKIKYAINPIVNQFLRFSTKIMHKLRCMAHIFRWGFTLLIWFMWSPRINAEAVWNCWSKKNKKGFVVTVYLHANISRWHIKSGFHSSYHLSPVITPSLEYAIQYSLPKELRNLEKLHQSFQFRQLKIMRISFITTIATLRT